MTADEQQDSFTIADNPETHRYELRDGAAVAGFAEYREHPDRLVFTHTVVDPDYGGQGLGSRLAKFVLDDAIARGKRIVPVCPFIAAYLRRHTEYEASVDWPDAAESGHAEPAR
jgi:predicted GNAT family acetyltransferase